MDGIEKLPFEGFANLYERSNKRVRLNIAGEEEIYKYTDYVVGDIAKNKEDLPNYYEYSCTNCKHLGVVKITISSLLEDEEKHVKP